MILNIDKEYFTYTLKDKTFHNNKETHTYSFKSHVCNQIYIVEIDLFENGKLAIIKFYLKNHSDSDYKYSLTLKNGTTKNFLLVLNTVFKIMLEYLNNDHYISFGFTGNPSIEYINENLEKHSNEDDIIEPNSKRYRIYIEKQFPISIPINRDKL